MATQYRVEVRGSFGGATGGWRPAITGTLNQTGKSDAEASTVTSIADADELIALVTAAGAAEADTRIVGPSGRTVDAWWAWHDADSSRWEPDLSDAERRCAAWVAGESDDGPETVEA